MQAIRSGVSSYEQLQQCPINRIQPADMNMINNNHQYIFLFPKGMSKMYDDKARIHAAPIGKKVVLI